MGVSGYPSHSVPCRTTGAAAIGTRRRDRRRGASRYYSRYRVRVEQAAEGPGASGPARGFKFRLGPRVSGQVYGASPCEARPGLRPGTRPRPRHGFKSGAGLASRGSWPVSRARNPARPREHAVQAVEGRAPPARSRSRICGLGWRGPRSPSGRAGRGLGAPLHVGLGRLPPLHVSSGMTRLGFPPPSRRTGWLLLITFILYTREGPRHACPTSHLPRLQLDYFSACFTCSSSR